MEYNEDHTHGHREWARQIWREVREEAKTDQNSIPAETAKENSEHVEKN